MAAGSSPAGDGGSQPRQGRGAQRLGEAALRIGSPEALLAAHGETRSPAPGGGKSPPAPDSAAAVPARRGNCQLRAGRAHSAQHRGYRDLGKTRRSL